jgi:hypothetical protein
VRPIGREVSLLSSPAALSADSAWRAKMKRRID